MYAFFTIFLTVCANSLYQAIKLNLNATTHHMIINHFHKTNNFTVKTLIVSTVQVSINSNENYNCPQGTKKEDRYLLIKIIPLDDGTLIFSDTWSQSYSYN